MLKGCAVELADLLSVEPSRDARILADTAHLESIPFADAPRLHPLGRRAGVNAAVLGGLADVATSERDKFAVLDPAVDVEGAAVKCAGALAINVPNIAGVVKINHHLEALALVVGAQEKTGARPPVVVHVDLHLEVVELAVAQQNAAVAGAWRILLADDCAVLDVPFAAGAMADTLRILVPTVERLAVEQPDPITLSGERLAKRQRGRGRCGGGFPDESTSRNRVGIRVHGRDATAVRAACHAA